MSKCSWTWWQYSCLKWDSILWYIQKYQAFLFYFIYLSKVNIAQISMCSLCNSSSSNKHFTIYSIRAICAQDWAPNRSNDINDEAAYRKKYSMIKGITSFPCVLLLESVLYINVGLTQTLQKETFTKYYSGRQIMYWSQTKWLNDDWYQAVSPVCEWFSYQ